MVRKDGIGHDRDAMAGQAFAKDREKLAIIARRGKERRLRRTLIDDVIVESRL